MKDTMFILGRVLGVIIFILVLSLLGLVSGNPLMILGYAAFFLVIMFLIFLFVRKSQRHFEVVSRSNQGLKKIIGIIIVLIALLIPLLVYQSPHFGRIGEIRAKQADLDKSTESVNLRFQDMNQPTVKEMQTLSENTRAFGNNLNDLVSSVQNYRLEAPLFNFTGKSGRAGMDKLLTTLAAVNEPFADTVTLLDSLADDSDSTKTVITAAQNQLLTDKITKLQETHLKPITGAASATASKLSGSVFLNCVISLLLWLALIAAGVFGVYLINRQGYGLLQKIVGYVIIIIASAVPALLVVPHDKTTTGIGSVYYVVVAVAVLSWWGLTLYLNKD